MKIYEPLSVEARQESLISTLIELFLCCGILYAIVSLSAFLASSAILGFLTVSAFLLMLSHFEGMLDFLCRNKRWTDGFLFLSSLFVGVQLGITAASSLIFAGIFFSLWLRWQGRHLPDKPESPSFTDEVKRKLKGFRIPRPWKRK